MDIRRGLQVKICLLTRDFSLDGGIGRVSSEVRSRLEELGHEVYSVSSDSKSLLGYFKYVFFDIRKVIPKGCDVYHAVTPMESIWIPKDKSVATVLDIIAITYPDKYGGRIGRNVVLRVIGKLLFTFACRQALKCRYVVCISEHVKQELLGRFHVEESKVSVVRLGIREDLLT